KLGVFGDAIAGSAGRVVGCRPFAPDARNATRSSLDPETAADIPMGTDQLAQHAQQASSETASVRAHGDPRGGMRASPACHSMIRPPERRGRDRLRGAGSAGAWERLGGEVQLACQQIGHNASLAARALFFQSFLRTTV